MLKMKGLNVQLIIVALVLFLPIDSWAQPGPPPDPDVPITGIEILLGLGGALGVKRLMGVRSKSKNL